MNISFRWLNHVEEQILVDEKNRSNYMSWSAFNAEEQTDEKPTDVSVLLPLFPDDSKSIAMMKHGMDVIKQAVKHLNGDQSPVIALISLSLQMPNLFSGIGKKIMEKISSLR